MQLQFFLYFQHNLDGLYSCHHSLYLLQKKAEGRSYDARIVIHKTEFTLSSNHNLHCKDLAAYFSLLATFPKIQCTSILRKVGS